MSTHQLEELAPRFWQRVDQKDGCWLWKGSLTVYGYGQFQPARGKSYRAHRLAWEIARGPVPEGLVLDHLCRNRACCNPDHLEPVTHRENVLRGVGPSAQNAARLTCSKGHSFDSVGSKGERRCIQCNNEKTGRWSRAQREAIVCGAPTRDGGPCKLKIALGKTCRNHATANVGTTK